MKNTFLNAVNQVEFEQKGTEETDLFTAILNARDELLDARRHFEYVYEDELIDYYTYKLKACEARYAYFIKLAKQKGIRGKEKFS